MSAALMIAILAISAASAQDTHRWIDKTKNDVRQKWIEKARNEPPGRNIKDGFGKPLRLVDYPPVPSRHTCVKTILKDFRDTFSTIKPLAQPSSQSTPAHRRPQRCPLTAQPASAYQS
ncbi:hypothetical protein [Bradyrhizobium sp. 144]|uniref:hypothetical protein n=1 Tax=Bradyrhizobium sp. 144 TaxID=2782620 RepID=UPI001FFA6A04|nr:hypothetical protein [Bradyrhizobium sp. 144]MCK1693096.1 hypothetical protein [Bradyrhizobium sp. 144]